MMTDEEHEIVDRIADIGERLGLTMFLNPESYNKRISLLANSPCMDMGTVLLRSVIEIGKSNNMASEDKRAYLVLFDRLEYDSIGGYHVVISDHMADIMVDNPDPEALARFNSLTKPSHHEILLTQVDLDKLKSKLEAFMVNLHECEQKYNEMSVTSAKETLDAMMYEKRREERIRKKNGTA